MADEKRPGAGAPPVEPRGFGEHVRGLASEYAHEQGWGLNEEERTRRPQEKQGFDGGTDYDYGARDFGDVPVDTSAVQPSPEAIKALLGDREQTTGAPAATKTQLPNKEPESMSQTHAHPANTPKAKHKSEHEAELPETAADPIPAPEHGGHPLSHAAHLEAEGSVRTKPEGNLRQGSAPGALREPPMVVTRVGKQHRG